MGNGELHVIKEYGYLSANSRGLISQLLIEIRNTDCSIGRSSCENFVHHSLIEQKLTWDLYVKIKNWYPYLKGSVWFAMHKRLKNGNQKKNAYLRQSIQYCNTTRRRSDSGDVFLSKKKCCECFIEITSNDKSCFSCLVS